ncbi:UNVERIFIED_CONTAM: hypothetical protein PYX00_004699 [Menopon gallinae]|uniref:Leucine-rich repeat-containing protein 27 n=1 Tax=Menopon gallinae TaxID=328185 RepID=A0AAW2I6F0_9NEOP
MSERDETQRGGKKAKNRGEEKPSGSVNPAPKKFQKLVIQTLLQKGHDKDEQSEEEDFVLPQFVGTNLDLTKKRLREFPSEILNQAEFVQYLYLEGNKLSKLPETFFQHLRHLKWLDLRNNELVAFPTVGLKNHGYLEFILLQGNRIKYLPTELGLLPNLKGLQISGNPIVNVPYDVISNGFQSIIKHLRRLNVQENILLPSSDAIIVRPSTVKDNSADNSDFSPTELEDDQICSVNDSEDLVNPQRIELEELVNESYAQFNKWNKSKQSLKSKLSAKQKQRLISLSYHHLTKKRSRLGYKRKMITPEMIQERAKKDLQFARKKETLEKQARKIQRMKDKETLKTWRRQTQINPEQMKILDNYQQYPSRNFMTDTPFDVDPEFLNMLNRTDLYRSLKEMEAAQKRKRKLIPKLRVSVDDIEKQMKEIRNKLESLNITDGDDISPRARQSHLCSKIAQMKDIQKTLQSLHIQNKTMTELPTASVNENLGDMQKKTPLACS